MKSHIALDAAQSEALARQLNHLLADYHLFYMNVRGYHWNIKGPKFFELHLKFEELYTDLTMKIDEVAERILTLGYTPLHSYSDFIKTADIRESKDISDGMLAVNEILSSFKILLEKQRAILKLSAESDDEGTNSLMSDYITAQEKLVWMYRSFAG
jgi:starvation-inducible DNA-binding protein